MSSRALIHPTHPLVCAFCKGSIWQDQLGYWYLADLAAENPWKCPANMLGHAPAAAEGEQDA